MTNDEHVIMGQLQQAVVNLSEQAKVCREENRADFDKVFRQLNHLQANGSALAERNAKDIERLNNAPARAVSIGAALIAIASGIASVVALWRE